MRKKCNFFIFINFQNVMQWRFNLTVPKQHTNQPLFCTNGIPIQNYWKWFKMNWRLWCLNVALLRHYTIAYIHIITKICSFHSKTFHSYSKAWYTHLKKLLFRTKNGHSFTFMSLILSIIFENKRFIFNNFVNHIW